MARVYQITEEEMQSLIESLELHKLREPHRGYLGPDLSHEERNRLEPVVNDLHRGFHFHVVRWAQKMGFDGYRK
jgi:hypothetical protein